MKNVKKLTTITLCCLMISQSIAFADVSTYSQNLNCNTLNNVSVETQENNSEEKIVGAFKIENGNIIELDPNIVSIEYDLAMQKLKYDELLKITSQNSPETRVLDDFKKSGNNRGIRYQYQKRVSKPLYNTASDTANFKFECSGTFSLTGNVDITWTIKNAIEASTGMSLNSSLSNSTTIEYPVKPGYTKWIEFAPNMDNVWGTLYEYNKDGILMGTKWIDAYSPVKLNGSADGVYVVKEKLGPY